MIEDNKFDQELLDRINTTKLKQTPRWHFLLKDYLVWAVGVLSLIIGGLAFSVVIYMLRYSDWDIHEQIGESFLGFILLSLPYFWLILLIMFIFLVYYNIEHTKSGYRYSMPIILLINLLLSLLLGLIFFRVGISQELDRVMGENMPFYPNIMNQRIGFWMQPEFGRLTGIVISREDEDNFTLLDFNQYLWGVDASNADKESFRMIIVGGPIRVFGKKATSSGVFVAERLLPVRPPGGGLYKHHRERHVIGENWDLRENIGKGIYFPEADIVTETK